MNTLLSEAAYGRQNHFNLIRAVAALMVIFTHSYIIKGYDHQPGHAYGIDAGYIAVDIFFITSGFLVTGSLLQRRDLWFFFWSRILRIFPALIATLLFCAFVVGPLFTNLSVGNYLTDTGVARFLALNLLLIAKLELYLPGVFAQNPKQQVNLSLWTLPWEIRSYLMLVGIGFAARLAPRIPYETKVKWIVTTLAVLFMALHLFDHYGRYPILYNLLHNLSTTFFKLGAGFFIGAALYCFRDQVRLSRPVFWSMVAVLALSLLSEKYFFVPYKLLLPYLVLYLAYSPNKALLRFNALPDYSYGLYIYSFPVQQALIALFPALSMWGLLAASVTVSLLLAGLSWRYIEEPALALKKQLSSYRPHRAWLLRSA